MTEAKRAFVFDMDGTIVDNMDFHTQSWVEFLRRHDIALDPEEFFRETAGRQGKEIIRKYLGEHFSDEQAGEDAIFLRYVAANGEPGALFSAHSDFIFANELADVLESDRRFEQLQASIFCHSVDQVRCRNASCDADRPTAALGQIICQ